MNSPQKRCSPTSLPAAVEALDADVIELDAPVHARTHGRFGDDESFGSFRKARISGVMVSGSFQRRNSRISRDRNRPRPVSKSGSSDILVVRKA